MKWATSVLVSFFPLAILAGCGGGDATSSNNSGSNSGGSSLPAGTELLYVGDNVGVIHGFGIDPSSGKPTPLPPTQIPIPPVTNNSTVANVALAADSGGLVLYAGVAGTGGPNVFSYIVDRTTGALSKSGSQALPVSWPVGLAAIEQNLYVIPDPSANAAQMFAFSVDPINAALTLLSPNVALPGVPNGLAVAPSGSWLGVTFDGNAGGEVAWFLRSPNGGATGLQPGSPASTGGTNADNITVTPDGKFVVVAGAGTSVFSLDPSTGALSEVPGSPFAIGDGMAIDPSGKFVFVKDGANNLSTYTIDAMGSLAPAGAPVPLGAQAESIAVDPTGKFVFVGLLPREVAGFTLDSTTGTLTPIAGSPFPLNSQGPTRGMAFMP
jgi:6-phosphogluconolactonase (cycloisomerase 2 family)